nr:MAG TPA: hypothetical protein [Caudoviricetes sp.]
MDYSICIAKLYIQSLLAPKIYLQHYYNTP